MFSSHQQFRRSRCWSKIFSPRAGALRGLLVLRCLSSMNDAMDQAIRDNVTSHENPARERQPARNELAAQLDDRTRELGLLKARFETALRGANVYVYSQDRDL